MYIIQLWDIKLKVMDITL